MTGEFVFRRKITAAKPVEAHSESGTHLLICREVVFLWGKLRLEYDENK